LGPVLASAAPDLTVRWREGERLDQLFEDQCDRLLEQGRGGHLAVDADGIVLTYSDLDRRANQLARHLLGCGARPGDRIALLFDQPSSAYTAMLAVLKIGAAYVPLDPGFPPDRLKYIVEDADVAVVLSLSHLKDLLPEVAALTICLDHVRAHENPDRLDQALIGGTKDELAYIIYTSGSAGSPKGVAIEHASICNFVRVASDLYGIESTDRVYQGMTIAFDFSVEEIWVSWLAGATLVPKPGDPSLLGIELASYLVEKRITALCCVPTLLATIDEDLPGLRFLLVSGDLLPQGASVYGPADRRRRHRHSQELCLSLLPCPLGRHRDGPRDFGKNVLVSEKTTLDIGTSMGDDAELGHASSLPASQSVPEGQIWHGSPLAVTSTEYRRVTAMKCSTRRRVIYSLLQPAGRLVLVVPGGVLSLTALLPGYLNTGDMQLNDLDFYIRVLTATLVGFIAALGTGLVFVLTVPRLLNHFLKPDVVYPLYGTVFAGNPARPATYPKTRNP
jgi:hypothetical protein